MNMMTTTTMMMMMMIIIRNILPYNRNFTVNNGFASRAGFVGLQLALVQ